MVLPGKKQGGPHIPQFGTETRQRQMHVARVCGGGARLAIDDIIGKKPDRGQHHRQRQHGCRGLDRAEEGQAARARGKGGGLVSHGVCLFQARPAALGKGTAAAGGGRTTKD